MAVYQIFGRDFTVRVIPIGEKLFSDGVEVDAILDRKAGTLTVSGSMSAQATANRVAKMTVAMCESAFRVRRERKRNQVR